MGFVEAVLYVLDAFTLVLTVFRSFLVGKKNIVISFIMQIVFLFLFFMKGNKTAVAVTVVTIILLIHKIYRTQTKLSLGIFIGIYFIVGVITLKNIYDILLVVANVMNVFSIYYNSRNEVKSKGFLIGFGLCWAIFDLLLGLYGAMLSAILTILTALIAYFKLRSGKRD